MLDEWFPRFALRTRTRVWIAVGFIGLLGVAVAHRGVWELLAFAATALLVAASLILEHLCFATAMAAAQAADRGDAAGYVRAARRAARLLLLLEPGQFRLSIGSASRMLPCIGDLAPDLVGDRLRNCLREMVQAAEDVSNSVPGARRRLRDLRARLQPQ